MKKLFLTAFILCLSVAGFSQVDTIYNKKQQKIPCKIVEINDLDIKYRPAGIIDGPLYVINRNTVYKYTLSNGFSEIIVPDEMSVENEHAEIIGNRAAIKIQPFSFVNNQISFAYEKVIRVGMNLDIEAGFSHSNINGTSGLYGFNPVFNTGAYVKPGVKFFLGQDFSVRGLRYAHPLKGRYIKLDLGFSYLNYQNLTRVMYPQYNQYPPVPTRTITSDMSVVAYGGFVNYGRQFILGNVLTMEYYVGAGFTGISYSYSNPEYTSSLNNSYPNYYGGYMEGKNVSNFHGFLRTPSLGLSFTAGFRIGYILPDKKKAPKPGLKTE